MINVTVLGGVFMSFLWGLQKSLPLPIGVVWWACFFALTLCFLLSLGGCKELYLSAFFFLTSCASFCAYISTEGGGEAATLTAFLFGALFGVTYPCLCGLLVLKRRLAEKRLRQKEGYVLPERNNELLRDRLKTRLCQGEEREILTAEAFQLPYVQKTLTKLKVAQLSPADRLVVEGIADEVEKHRFQKTLSSEELRRLNESFGKVLKLAAKYAV